ncbi:MAG: hypothetical protein HY402_06520, partial [Elusimicrobia bacterium]|nr:hypothetical protein [Elusimicrobiota bacterium]
PGPTIGIALEDFPKDNPQSKSDDRKTGTVLTFIDIGERNLAEVVKEQKKKIEAQAAKLQKQDQKIEQLSSALQDVMMRVGQLEAKTAGVGEALWLGKAGE